MRGISQQRVRRLIRHLPASKLRDRIPPLWSRGLNHSAGLFTVEHWRHALANAGGAGEDASQAILSMLDLVAKGSGIAADAGELLLSRALWDEALRIAPPEALEFALGELRVPDGLDPGNSIVWCPAVHLAASPRPWVRLLGMTSRSWPRAETEDALLPDHILPRRTLEPVSLTDRDRRQFDVIKRHAGNGLVLSRARRNALGALQTASALWPVKGETHLSRTRVPKHAYGESDRLLARLEEARDTPRLAAGPTCWRNWQQQALTPHDGAYAAAHPVVERALSRTQSTTSMRRLLRDPLGFVWRYALGWESPELEQQPLSLPPPVFGELVHELLRRTIRTLEPEPGFARATQVQIRSALDAAMEEIAGAWPLERAVPPPLLWRHTLEQAARMTFRGLTVDDPLQPGSRSWSEVPFGEATPPIVDALPWDPKLPVTVAEASTRFRGRIDRVDIRAAGDAVRISDYKSGHAPDDAAVIAIDGGKELQRVLYAMTARQLIPDVRTVVSRLVYLAGESRPCSLSGDRLDEAIAEVTRFIAIGCAVMRSGFTVPGPDAHDPYNDLRLALPADRDAYAGRKEDAFANANKDLAALWSRT
jgi:PD-(D/E)XK nuclease superfamily protein